MTNGNRSTWNPGIPWSPRFCGKPNRSGSGQVCRVSVRACASLGFRHRWLSAESWFIQKGVVLSSSALAGFRTSEECSSPLSCTSWRAKKGLDLYGFGLLGSVVQCLGVQGLGL